MDENLTRALNQLSIARNEIKNLRQEIISLRHRYKKDVEEIKESLDNWECSHCQEKPSTSQISDDFQQNNSNEISSDKICKIIGCIETGFTTKRGVPRQPGILSQSQGIIRLDNTILTNPEHALEGLEQFSHMWILFYFHENHNTHLRAKVAPPRLNGIKTGVFATRSPHRPSPVGLSLVKIDNIEDNCIYFSGVDMINGTPVIDIKPYIPQYDSPYPSHSSNFTYSNSNANSLGDNCFIHNRNLQWERLPRESDGRSEDGDSILQDQSDADIDFQDRLLIGEPSQTSDLNEASVFSIPTNSRILDGRDSDVFLYDSVDSGINQTNNGDDVLSFRSPLRSTSQREAPEGREETSPSSPLLSGSPRIANWIVNPPVSRFRVQFSENSLVTINRLMKKSNSRTSIRSSITAVLSEDPRSTYLRNQHPNEHFTCIIERLIVTCLFDDIINVCVVTNIKEENENN